MNGYWMCDIGRFDYHWIEGDDRLRRPLVRGGAAACSNRSPGTTCCRGCATSLAAAGRANPEGVRFLVSAHASHEELFLFRRLAEELVGGAAGAITRQLAV